MLVIRRRDDVQQAIGREEITTSSRAPLLLELVVGHFLERDLVDDGRFPVPDGVLLAGQVLVPALVASDQADAPLL